MLQNRMKVGISHRIYGKNNGGSGVIGPGQLPTLMFYSLVLLISYHGLIVAFLYYFLSFSHLPVQSVLASF